MLVKKPNLFIILIALGSGLLAAFNLSAQTISPVSWSFYSLQIAPGIYEVHTIATVKEGWRFHNQTPVDVAPVVGNLLFFKNSNVLLIRNGQSVRTMAEPVDKASAADTSRSYESNIHLVHLVRLKEGVATSLAGEVEYTVHNDRQRALIQDKISFNVLLR